MFRNIYKISSFLFCMAFLFISFEALATHNRAGEITYEILDTPDGLTIRATITTYTKASSIAADRDTLDICWGDGSCDRIGRVNGEGELLPNDTKVNYYVQTHTYPGPAHYVISMTDPNRNGGILNVNFPNSDMVPFHLETTITFFNPAFQGPNNSPILSQPPIDIACIGQVFIHNPNAYDPDGDSLAYRMIVPLQDINTEVPNYEWPFEIIDPDNAPNTHTLNETSGDFIWNTPDVPGEYNIAMIIIQYREGIAIDTLIRDMQILVKDCENIPPEIETEDEICVIAGEFIQFPVIGTAPLVESDQRVELRAFGAPLELENSPATFTVAPGYQPQPLTGVFRWQTTCEHIADQFYSVIFRVADDFPILDSTGDTLYLSSLKKVRIKVVGPPPEDVQAVPGTGEVELTWEQPYACEDVEDEYFRGFTVWRKETNIFTLDTCDPGLEGKGFRKLTISPIQDLVDGRFYFLDTDVERGRTYCYRIQAEFAKVTIAGFEYNWVEGLASDEVCVQLSRDIPLITNVSVLQTDNTDGEIFVQWSKPDAEDLDTLLNPGPYIYEVLRAVGTPTDPADFEKVTGATFTSPSFAMANDTFYTDTGLNTRSLQYSYIIAFYANNEEEPIGYATAASSVFLNIASSDEINQLSWDFSVPWDNNRYLVYKFNGTDWDSIATTSEPFYDDENVINEKEYCYYVETEGSYGISGVLDPLFNNSQEACGTPLDSIPPCPPTLVVTNICDELNGTGQVNCDSEEDLENDLTWKNPMDICEETDDVVSYNIYYSPVEGGQFELIETITSSSITDYAHRPDLGIAGCYAVTAVDSFLNESAFSNIECVDNCPIYELPNVFTPNNDGANDLYTPFPYCFVESVEMTIYNRWGEVVFETNDPDIRWAGKNLKGEDLSEGVYHYTCRVFEQRVSGIVPRVEILSGFIQLIRGR